MSDDLDDPDNLASDFSAPESESELLKGGIDENGIVSLHIFPLSHFLNVILVAVASGNYDPDRDTKERTGEGEDEEEEMDALVAT